MTNDHWQRNISRDKLHLLSWGLIYWEFETVHHCAALAMDSNADPEDHMMIERSVSQTMQIDPRQARFPCCIVWTPLPVISWLIPFVGHIGICREDGVILDFAGPNFVCVDNFAFGAVTRYIQISKEKVRVPNFIFETVIVPTSLPSAGSWHTCLGRSLMLFHQMEKLVVGLHTIGKRQGESIVRMCFACSMKWLQGLFAPWSNALGANCWNSIPSLILGAIFTE